MGCSPVSFRKTMAKVNPRSKKRIFISFLVIMALFLALLLRTAWIQIVKGDEYASMASAQQTSDIPVQPARGDILDRNGEKLATSVTCYAVWVRPQAMQENYSEEKLKEVSDSLAVAIGMDSSKLETILNSDETLLSVKHYLEKATADKVRELDIYGVELVEETKRYYPMGTFASVVLGSVNDEGVGRSGIEQEYNDYLTGIAGRWAKDTDVFGNPLSYGEKLYYEAEDGLNVETTLDEVLQHYLEDAMEQGYQDTVPTRIMGMVMDPKTGDILAMATYPSFDPNDPYAPYDAEEKKRYEAMDATEQTNYLSAMWRNPLISDTYEPGSTMKLLTASSVLEEGLATPETTYTCNGFRVVEDQELHCWESTVHGTLSLKDAVAVSCNPAHVEMALSLGKDRYYDYLDLFGITQPTGVDLPAEGTSLVQSKDDIGNVELATMGFGQGIAITPIQLTTAISAIGNDGVLMRPRIVKALTDDDGNVVKAFAPQEVRKVLSSQTAKEMCDIMENEVLQGGGVLASIEGYRIGGKTGTANKPDDQGGYSSDTYNSFICIAPMEDPQLTVSIIVDTPTRGQYGGGTAAPIARNFLEKALPYLNLSPVMDSSEEGGSGGYSYVPDVTGLSYEDAAASLDAFGLKYEIRPSLDAGEDLKTVAFTVVDQYPKAGKKIGQGGTVYLYRE